MFLALTMLALPVSAYAQQSHIRVSTTLLEAPTTSSSELDVGEAISPLKITQRAPFTGVLLSPKATASIIAQISTFDERLGIELRKAKDDAMAGCDFKTKEIATKFNADKAILTTQLDARNKDVSALNSQLLDIEKNASNKWTWFFIGGAIGTTVTIAATVLIFAVTK